MQKVAQYYCHNQQSIKAFSGQKSKSQSTVKLFSCDNICQSAECHPYFQYNYNKTPVRYFFIGDELTSNNTPNRVMSGSLTDYWQYNLKNQKIPNCWNSSKIQWNNRRKWPHRGPRSQFGTSTSVKSGVVLSYGPKPLSLIK